MKVKSIMMPYSTITIDSSYTLAEIGRFFKSMRTDYLTIADNGQFVGILCRDKFRKFVDGHNFSIDRMSRTSVLVLVEEDPHFCEPEHHISDVFNRMGELGLRYLAVRSLGKIVGVLSFSTVAAAVASGPIERVPTLEG